MKYLYRFWTELIVLYSIFLLLGFTSSKCQSSTADDGEKPNVIIIFTDDQGVKDIHLYGSEDLHTPNMDSIARSGVMFSQFYAGAPVCSPSRAVLMTGQVPQKNEQRDQMVIGTDWFRTILDYTGIKAENLSLDGKSLRGVIENNEAPSPHETLHWMTPIQDQRAVRKGEWKLIGNPWQAGKEARKDLTKKDILFLVNMEKDKTEQTNFAGQYPDKVKELNKLHEEWVNSLEQ